MQYSTLLIHHVTLGAPQSVTDDGIRLCSVHGARNNNLWELHQCMVQLLLRLILQHNVNE